MINAIEEALSKPEMRTRDLGGEANTMPQPMPLLILLRIDRIFYMDYRRLGRTDLMVSAFCLGSMTWGTQNTEAEGHAQ